MTDIANNRKDPAAFGDFKTGLLVCWLSIIALPIGLLAIGGGPCAGPRNALGSAILLTVGAVGIATGVFGIIRISQGIKEAKRLALLGGALSLTVGAFTALVGAVYLLIGVESLQVYLRH